MAIPAWMFRVPPSAGCSCWGPTFPLVSQEELKMEYLQRSNANSIRGRLSWPRHRLLVRMALVATALFYAASLASAQDALDEMLTPYLARYGLPALAAAVVKDGRSSRSARSGRGGPARRSR